MWDKERALEARLFPILIHSVAGSNETVPRLQGYHLKPSPSRRAYAAGLSEFRASRWHCPQHLTVFASVCKCLLTILSSVVARKL